MPDAKTGPTDAYSMILEAIDIGTYRPGDRLVESELAERFGVSRTPIREALQRLETQSLLMRDGRSLIVASLDHRCGCGFVTSSLSLSVILSQSLFQSFFQSFLQSFLSHARWHLIAA